MKKSHLGLGVILAMSAKGTATLTASMLLPNWPLRIAALLLIVAIAAVAIVRHRRKKASEQGS